MRICPKCGHENYKSNMWCEKCNAKLFKIIDKSIQQKLETL
jgi:uncharacterized OB-fold protein